MYTLSRALSVTLCINVRTVSRYEVLKDREVVQRAIDESSSMLSAITTLGLPYSIGTIQLVVNACVNFGIEVNFPARGSGRRLTDAEIFVENSPYLANRVLLKQKFIKLTGVPLACAICGIDALWNDLPLTLQLDHVNGISNDHRLENLRLLCPNCHTQTPTFSNRHPTTIPGQTFTCRHRHCQVTFTPSRARPNQPPKFCSPSCAVREAHHAKLAA